MLMHRNLERQLATAQQITHIGSWEWNVRTNAVAWSDELYRIYGLEPQSCAITLESFLARVHPDDRPRTEREVRAALERGRDSREATVPRSDDPRSSRRRTRSMRGRAGATPRSRDQFEVR
jgi:PAS domain-containing protein